MLTSWEERRPVGCGQRASHTWLKTSPPPGGKQPAKTPRQKRPMLREAKGQDSTKRLLTNLLKIKSLNTDTQAQTHPYTHTTCRTGLLCQHVQAPLRFLAGSRGR